MTPKIHKLSSLVMSFCLVSLAFSASPPARSAPSDDLDDFRDASGAKVFIGAPSDSLTAAADRLAAVADANPDIFQGASFTSHYRWVEVYCVVSAMQQCKRLLGSSFSQQGVRLMPVEESSQVLRNKFSTILSSSPGSGVVVQQVGISPGEGLVAEVSAPQAASGLASSIDEKSLAAALGVSRVTRGQASTFSTRNYDTPPFKAGAHIQVPNPTGLDLCTLNVPVRLANGVRGALTAGHCGSGKFTTSDPNRVVGSTYTTTWTGSASKYGDWQILTGSTYSSRVFNGGPGSSTSTIAVTGAYLSPLAKGRQLCASGQTTGQLCRYVVDTPDTATRACLENGPCASIAPVSVLIHDSNLDGVRDCAGWIPGDSGGPTYYSNGSGGVIAYGLITSFTSMTCAYVTTQLKGVASWSPGATFGG